MGLKQELKKVQSEIKKLRNKEKSLEDKIFKETIEVKCKKMIGNCYKYNYRYENTKEREQYTYYRILGFYKEYFIAEEVIFFASTVDFTELGRMDTRIVTRRYELFYEKNSNYSLITKEEFDKEIAELNEKASEWYEKDWTNTLEKIIKKGKERGDGEEYT